MLTLVREWHSLSLLFLTGLRLTREQENTLHLLINAGLHSRHSFGFEPCYVNSRLAARGIPVSCEVDIYGALSEYIGLAFPMIAVTLLDINNSVPQYIYDEDIKGKYDYKLTDTFMGFHCGKYSCMQDV